MTGRNKGHLDTVANEGFAIGNGLTAAGEILAIADRHDRERLRRGDGDAVAGAGVVRMAMGDHRPVHGADRVDIEVARRAVEAARSGTEEIFGLDHVWIRQRKRR